MNLSVESAVDKHVRDGHKQFDRHNERIVPHDIEKSTIGCQQPDGIERKFEVKYAAAVIIRKLKRAVESYTYKTLYSIALLVSSIALIIIFSKRPRAKFV